MPNQTVKTMLIHQERFAKNFQGQPVPQALQLLTEAWQNDLFAMPEGFEFYEDDGNSGIKAGWTTAAGAVQNLFTFAQANNAGSFYALWRQHEGQSTDDMPVVLFGDEGGTMIVAPNARALMELLTVYAEPYISSDYNADEDLYPSGRDYIRYSETDWAEITEYDEDRPARFQAFVDWIGFKFQYAPLTPEQAMEKTKAYQTQWQSAFEAWFKQFPLVWEE